MLHMVNYKLLLMWGFPLFIVFDCVAYGQLQTLASVGLSVFYRFYSRHMIHYRLLTSVGLVQAHPITSCCNVLIISRLINTV